MNLTPQKHVCPKCGFESMFSPSNEAYQQMTADGLPVCPRCWQEWLKANVPLMLVQPKEGQS